MALIKECDGAVSQATSVMKICEFVASLLGIVDCVQELHVLRNDIQSRQHQANCKANRVKEAGDPFSL